MFPPFFQAATGVNVMSTITSRIAEFTAALTYADLPITVREKIKVSLLHNLGMAVSAGTLVDVSNRYSADPGESESENIEFASNGLGPKSVKVTCAHLCSAGMI
jgi:2-methylcitrate dehydratase PrpD